MKNNFENEAISKPIDEFKRLKQKYESIVCKVHTFDSEKAKLEKLLVELDAFVETQSENMTPELSELVRKFYIEINFEIFCLNTFQAQYDRENQRE